jgi:cobalt-zinc-cadmium efflux system membrane fusion protein
MNASVSRRSLENAARRARRFVPAVACGAALLATVGAWAHEGEDHGEAPAAVVRGAGLMRLPDGSVNVPKLAQRRLSIRTQVSPRTTAAATVELPGRVLMDPATGGRVQASHGGRIEAGPKGLPTVGARVRKGDVLAYVRHHQDPSARAEQQAQYAELKAGERVAAERVARLESLEGSVARKDIEAARAELEGYRARVGAIGGALTAREALIAPVGGVVASANAVVGQVVGDTDVLFEVVDPAAIMVEATTTDPAIASGVARAALQGVPGVELKLLGAGRSLRDGVLPLVFRATAKGAAPPIAVGQPVTVVAELKGTAQGVRLPASAIVRNPQNEPVVYIKSGAERFIPQPVQFQPLDATTILVTQGLDAENRVVVQGASLLAQIR